MRRKWSNDLAPRFRTSCRRAKFDMTCNDVGSFPAREISPGAGHDGEEPDSKLTDAIRETTRINTACFPVEYRYPLQLANICRKYLKTSSGTSARSEPHTSRCVCLNPVLAA